MTAALTVFRGHRVVGEHGFGPASVHVRGGVIERVDDIDRVPREAEVVDVGHLVLMAGLVDTSVRVNEPGRADWEGFASATRAAAAGGVTTIVDMPHGSIPPITRVAALEAVRQAAAGQCRVDVGFAAALVPENVDELEALHAAGVLAFACTLVPLGVPDVAPVSEADLRRALPVLARLGATLVVHPELPGPIDAAQARAGRFERRRYRAWRAARPRTAENEAVRLLAALSREFGARVHVFPVTNHEALQLVRVARRARVALTAGTAPHYLHLTSDRVPEGGTEFKCAPPIREHVDREQLWSALRDRVVTSIVSDHAPAPSDLRSRRGDFVDAWAGIASLELGLAAVWTEARRRGYEPPALAYWMCEQSARLVGLGARKGRIAPGYDADFCLWRPDGELKVRADALRQRHKATPYAGATLYGKVEATYLAGVPVFERRELRGEPGGRLLSGTDLRAIPPATSHER